MLTDTLNDAVDEHGVVAVIEVLRRIMWQRTLNSDTLSESQIYARIAVALEGAV